MSARWSPSIVTVPNASRLIATLASRPGSPRWPSSRARLPASSHQAAMKPISSSAASTSRTARRTRERRVVMEGGLEWAVSWLGKHRKDAGIRLDHEGGCPRITLTVDIELRDAAIEVERVAATELVAEQSSEGVEIHRCLADRKDDLAGRLGAYAAAPFQAGRVVDELLVELAVDHQHRAGLGCLLRGLALGLEGGAGAHGGVAVGIDRKHAVRKQREIARGRVAVGHVQRHLRLAILHVQAQWRKFVVVDAGVGGKQQSPAVRLAPLAQVLDAAERPAILGIAPVQAELLALQVDMHDAIILPLERQLAAVQRLCLADTGSGAGQRQGGEQPANEQTKQGARGPMWNERMHASMVAGQPCRRNPGLNSCVGPAPAAAARLALFR